MAMALLSEHVEVPFSSSYRYRKILRFLQDPAAFSLLPQRRKLKLLACLASCLQEVEPERQQAYLKFLTEEELEYKEAMSYLYHQNTLAYFMRDFLEYYTVIRKTLTQANVEAVVDLVWALQRGRDEELMERYSMSFTTVKILEEVCEELRIGS